LYYFFRSNNLESWNKLYDWRSPVRLSAWFFTEPFHSISWLDEEKTPALIHRNARGHG